MLKNKKIIIIGAGVAGQLLAKNIQDNYPNIRIAGFVDDDQKFKDSKNVGKITDLPKIIKRLKVEEIVIAIPSANGDLIRKILLTVQDSTVPVRIVPRDQRIISYDKVEYIDVVDIGLEDFLGRPFIKGDIQKLKSYFEHKTVLITGGAGSIGSEIVQQLLSLDVKKVIVYDNSEFLTFNLDQNLREKGIRRSRYHLVIGNILNDNKLEKIIQKEKPDLVFHAAAYKHVYLMEDNPEEAITNNLIGTKKVVDIAIKNGIKHFVFISTDKVVNPTSVMGATKKLSEYYIKSIEKRSDTKFTIVRFGNVINSNGSVLPLFDRQIKENGYITVTHKEIRRYFMSIKEASHLVITSAFYDKKGNVYVLDMGDLINIYEVAKCLIRSKSLIPGKDIEIKFIGLKKGEKMIEELFTEKEKKNLIKTDMEDIMCVKNFGDSPHNIEQIIAKFEKLVVLDETKIKLFLKKIFPSLLFK